MFPHQSVNVLLALLFVLALTVIVAAAVSSFIHSPSLGVIVTTIITESSMMLYWLHLGVQSNDFPTDYILAANVTALITPPIVLIVSTGLIFALSHWKQRKLRQKK